ncbi:MAG TPA: hypothetical protein VMQ11_12480 [Alphaproteobacteria bacterium]|nr:hypothetical protein [Alphaproteobacteria bacterium]
MSALQLSPISGPSATAAGASPAGDAAATQKTAPSSKTATPPAQPTGASASRATQAARATAAADAAAAQTAATENAREVARIETPSLNLSVGLVGGSFDVYVDLTDSSDGRVVARLYGPKGGTPEPHHPAAPTRVRTEA